MVLSMLPPWQLADAATQQRYELDTDGIDPGATYLIVNTRTKGTGKSLMFNYVSNYNRSFKNQALTVKQDEKGVIYIDTG